MKHFLFIILTTILTPGIAPSQTTTPSPAPQQKTPRAPVQQRQGAPFQVSDYGVDFQPDQRLIVVMAALEAAGLDLTAGRQPSVFRARLRKDLATLDPDLREKMRNF